MAKGGFRGGMPMGGMNQMQMMKQAQKMQQDLLKMQQEMEEKQYEATAGGGVITAVVSGKLPDMIDINTYSMPIEQYAAKGFLTDLYELIDADADLSRESFVQPVLKALESADGKLYQLPSTFAVSTAIALDKVAGDYDTWNLAAVKDAMTKLQDGASVFDVYRTKSDILQTCISRNIDAFVDWENGGAHFDSDEFKALLEFANQFPDTYDWENATDEENDSAQNRINSGKQLMTDMYDSSFEDMLYQLTGFNGGVKFVGYPSEDGTSNHAFQIDGAIAISSTSDVSCREYFTEITTDFLCKSDFRYRSASRSTRPTRTATS